MSLLIEKTPYPLLPTLVKHIGTKEAVFLQQLHFRLLISIHEHDGYTWYYKTL